MAVGDINSDAPGSGARYNDGKLAMDLIPVSFWRAAWAEPLAEHRDLDYLLCELERFQYGYNLAPAAILEYFGSNGLVEATKVLEFGAKKYAAWNWAKGMKWSVPTGCILRHAYKILIENEPIDEESGESHIAHILCNVVMLEYFLTHYSIGDDRPPVNKG